MTRERAKSMDQTSFWTSGTAEAPGKLRRPPMASPEPGRMLAFAPFQGIIRGMSSKPKVGGSNPSPGTILLRACALRRTSPDARARSRMPSEALAQEGSRISATIPE